MKKSTNDNESRINSKLFVVLFIIIALLLAYISFRWQSDRLEETEERATQTQEAEPTDTSSLPRTISFFAANGHDSGPIFVGTPRWRPS